MGVPAAVERADDAPVGATQRQMRAHIEAFELPLGAAPDDQLAQSAAEHPPFNQPDFRPQSERLRANAANRDI